MLTEIRKNDKYAQDQMDTLLEKEGIRRDASIDYSCGIFDDDYELIAAGSCYRNTIRCTAVSSGHRGEGLLNRIMTHLMTVQAERGNGHVFLYTKPDSAQFFSDIGFYEIVRLDDLVFMENRRNGLSNWISGLERPDNDGKAAAVVMNANPFTLGHRYLAEKASEENDIVHVFVLREEAGPIPFEVRSRLVMEGTSGLGNLVYHDSGSYMISSATFPAYFLKDEEAAVKAQAELDIRIFSMIARELGISSRYVGDEPFSDTTRIYNDIMAEKLPGEGIDCVIVPRLKLDGAEVSASDVRQSIHDGDMEKAFRCLPQSSIDYFSSAAAKPVIDAIKAQSTVRHH